LHEARNHAKKTTQPQLSIRPARGAACQQLASKARTSPEALALRARYTGDGAPNPLNNVPRKGPIPLHFTP
ncbi:MAG: hypothetical protein ACPG2Q_10905, partial [Pseudohongiellaceae bacterium]